MGLRPTFIVMVMLTTVTAAMWTPAMAQWNVRPAPPSWGLPQSAPTPAPQSAAQTQVQILSSSPTTFDDAINCAAALQLATMAAPNWAQEKGIITITNAWLQKVFVLGETRNIAGDQVPKLVEAQMQRQVESAARDPDSLSRSAFECASRQP